MTVSELIAQLQKLDPAQTVVIATGDPDPDGGHDNLRAWHVARVEAKGPMHMSPDGNTYTGYIWFEHGEAV